MADFLISHTGADAAISDEIARALDAAGFTVDFWRWEVGLGDDPARWTVQALEDCEGVIAVCSKAYFSKDAPYSALERNVALWAAAGGDKLKLIPVMVSRCKLPRVLATRVYFDLTKQSIAELVDQLLHPPKGGPGTPRPLGDRQVGTDTVVAGPMPILPRTIRGRDEDVRDLRDGLLQQGHAAILNGTVVKGQGGIGKTMLARYYVETFRQDYDGVFWGVADNQGALVNALYDLHHPMFDKLPPVERSPEGARAILAAVKESRQNWLFVYDNVTVFKDIEGFMPTGHLIVTTREASGWAGFAEHRTLVLDYATEAGAAVALLMAEARCDDDPAGARALAEALGGLPLALVMAGALIHDEGQSFAEYLTEVARIIATEPKNEAYPDSVIGAVKLSYDKLGPDAKVVADLFAWWAPEGLTAELISGAPEGQWWSRYEDELPEAVRALALDGARVRAGMAELADRSLTQRGADGAEMHRMTAAALRALQAGRGAGEVAEAAAVLLMSVYPGGARGLAFSENWPLCRRLTPHVRALWASGAAPETAAMDTLLNQAAIYLDKISDFPGGVEMARAALALTEARLPEAHRDIAVGLATLGVALRRIGDLDGALAYLDRAVALNAAHRPGSADLADSYDLQGGVLYEIGRGGDGASLVRAAKRYQQALALRRGLSGRRSDPVAEALNNLGAVRSAQGRTAAAARLYGASLAIRRAVLPPGDARLGYGLVNTGAMWLKAGRADRAEPLLAEALELRRAVYAGQPQHPDTRAAAQWLIACSLVRARAGEDRGRREAVARQLCAEFGFDFNEMRASVAQFPYDGAGDDGGGA